MNAARETAGITATTAAREARWGGAALALGAICFVMGIVLGLQAFEGSWDTSVGATLPGTAALIQEKWSSFRAIWFAELLGALLIACAAFLLLRRPQARLRSMPASVVWIVMGVGSMILAVQYAFCLGSYPPALAAFADEPAVFAAVRGGVLFMHLIGTILQLLGVLAALTLEFRWEGRGVPDRLVQGGAGITLLGILAAVGGLIPGEYGSAAIFLAAALLGLAISMKAGEGKAAVLVAADA
jgi:hypothetical protein